MKRFATMLFVVAAIAATAFAQGDWRVDKGHSAMLFTVRHLVISEVVGKFNDWEMKVTSTKDDWSDATVEATAKIISLNSDNERRDNHLKSGDFFDAEKFPEMKFVSTKFEKNADGKFKITGNLTIKDVTKQVVFEGEILGKLTDARMGTRVGWKATTEIDRFEFGLKWDRATEAGNLIAGKTVKITINLELVKQTT